jgi:hypothetical protein
VLDEVWKYKLILVETPDAAETSLALETYRTVPPFPVFSNLRLVTTVVALSSSASPEAKSPKESTLTINMAAL